MRNFLRNNLGVRSEWFLHIFCSIFYYIKMQHFLFCIPHYYSHINRMVALLPTWSWNNWICNQIRQVFGWKFDYFNHMLSIVPAIWCFYVCSIESISRCAQDFYSLKSSICVHTKTPNKLVRIHTWMWKEKISCAISCVSLCLSAKRPPSHINIICYDIITQM